MEQEQHSEYFERLKESFDAIQSYRINSDVDIDKYTMLFGVALIEINTKFHECEEILLKDEEFPIVQGWINKVIGNNNIPRKTRKLINKENLYFCSMVESVNDAFNK